MRRTQAQLRRVLSSFSGPGRRGQASASVGVAPEQTARTGEEPHNEEGTQHQHQPREQQVNGPPQEDNTEFRTEERDTAEHPEEQQHVRLREEARAAAAQFDSARCPSLFFCSRPDDAFGEGSSTTGSQDASAGVGAAVAQAVAAAAAAVGTGTRRAGAATNGCELVAWTTAATHFLRQEFVEGQTVREVCRGVSDEPMIAADLARAISSVASGDEFFATVSEIVQFGDDGSEDTARGLRATVTTMMLENGTATYVVFHDAAGSKLPTLLSTDGEKRIQSTSAVNNSIPGGQDSNMTDPVGSGSLSRTQQRLSSSGQQTALDGSPAAKVSAERHPETVQQNSSAESVVERFQPCNATPKQSQEQKETFSEERADTRSAAGAERTSDGIKPCAGPSVDNKNRSAITDVTHAQIECVLQALGVSWCAVHFGESGQLDVLDWNAHMAEWCGYTKLDMLQRGEAGIANLFLDPLAWDDMRRELATMQATHRHTDKTSHAANRGAQWAFPCIRLADGDTRHASCLVAPLTASFNHSAGDRRGTFAVYLLWHELETFATSHGELVRQECAEKATAQRCQFLTFLNHALCTPISTANLALQDLVFTLSGSAGGMGDALSLGQGIAVGSPNPLSGPTSALRVGSGGGGAGRRRASVTAAVSLSASTAAVVAAHTEASLDTALESVSTVSEILNDITCMEVLLARNKLSRANIPVHSLVDRAVKINEQIYVNRMEFNVHVAPEVAKAVIFGDRLRLLRVLNGMIYFCGRIDRNQEAAAKAAAAVKHARASRNALAQSSSNADNPVELLQSGARADLTTSNGHGAVGQVPSNNPHRGAAQASSLGAAVVDDLENAASRRHQHQLHAGRGGGGGDGSSGVGGGGGGIGSRGAEASQLQSSSMPCQTKVDIRVDLCYLPGPDATNRHSCHSGNSDAQQTVFSGHNSGPMPADAVRATTIVGDSPAGVGPSSSREARGTRMFGHISHGIGDDEDGVDPLAQRELTNSPTKARSQRRSNSGDAGMVDAVRQTLQQLATPRTPRTAPGPTAGATAGGNTGRMTPGSRTAEEPFTTDTMANEAGTAPSVAYVVIRCRSRGKFTRPKPDLEGLLRELNMGSDWAIDGGASTSVGLQKARARGIGAAGAPPLSPATAGSSPQRRRKLESQHRSSSWRAAHQVVADGGHSIAEEGTVSNKENQPDGNRVGRQSRAFGLTLGRGPDGPDRSFVDSPHGTSSLSPPKQRSRQTVQHSRLSSHAQLHQLHVDTEHHLSPSTTSPLSPSKQQRCTGCVPILKRHQEEKDGCSSEHAGSPVWLERDARLGGVGSPTLLERRHRSSSQQGLESPTQSLVGLHSAADRADWTMNDLTYDHISLLLCAKIAALHNGDLWTQALTTHRNSSKRRHGRTTNKAATKEQQSAVATDHPDGQSSVSGAKPPSSGRRERHRREKPAWEFVLRLPVQFPAM